MFTEFGDEVSLEIGAIFWEMAIEERSHHSLLQEKYREQYGSSSSCLTEDELAELIEVPRLENGDVFGAGNDAVTSREQALQVALYAELSAQGFYRKLGGKNSARGPAADLLRLGLHGGWTRCLSGGKTRPEYRREPEATVSLSPGF